MAPYTSRIFTNHDRIRFQPRRSGRPWQKIHGLCAERSSPLTAFIISHITHKLPFPKKERKKERGGGLASVSVKSKDVKCQIDLSLPLRTAAQVKRDAMYTTFPVLGKDIRDLLYLTSC